MGQTATTEKLPPASPLSGVLKAMLAVAAVIAAGGLALDMGFRWERIVDGVWVEKPLTLAGADLARYYLYYAQAAAVALFLLERVLAALLCGRPAEFLRRNWIDFALLALGAAGVAANPHILWGIVSAGALYVVLTQAYALGAWAVRGVAGAFEAGGLAKPVLWLACGFVVLMMLGSVLLMLPTATPDDKQPFYYDMLFTSTAAACLTAFSLRDIGADFTPFGQAVILTLVQAGGLAVLVAGTIVGTRFARGMGSGMGVPPVRGVGLWPARPVGVPPASGCTVAKESAGETPATLAAKMAAPRHAAVPPDNSLASLSRLASRIIILALVLEAVGAVLLYPMFSAMPGVAQHARPLHAAWYSVFHSVSAFCNSGLSLCGDNLMQGVREDWPRPLRDCWQVFGVIGLLVVLGGLGYPVLADAGRCVRQWLAALRSHSPARPELSLQSQVVIQASLVLIVVGALLMLAVEPQPGEQAERIGRTPVGGMSGSTLGDWQRLQWPQRMRQAIFQSISARGGGFHTIECAELSSAGKLSICGLMLVGGSPASAAGGMKTVTIGILLAAIVATLRRRRQAMLFGKGLPARLVLCGMTAAGLYLSAVLVTALLLCVLERGQTFIDVLFLASSAMGNVGLSSLPADGMRIISPGAKYVLIGAMFVGRLGPMLLAAVLAGELRARATEPTEDTLALG